MKHLRALSLAAVGPLVATAALGVGCGSAAPAPARPAVASLPAWELAITVEPALPIAVRAVAAEARGAVAAAASVQGASATIGGRSVPLAGGADALVALVEPGGTLRWATAIGGAGDESAGPVAIAGGHVVAAIGYGGATRIGETAIEPASTEGEDALVAFDAATGAVTWSRRALSSRYARIRDLAALPDGGLVAVGYFAGTLRLGDSVVTSAGWADGFAARLDATGAVRWIVRFGGQGSDQAVAVAALADGRVAIAGTFAGAIDLRGTSIEPRDRKSVQPDGLLALLDPTGVPQWTTVLGGRAPDAIRDLAADADGLVVAGSFRDEATLGDGADPVSAPHPVSPFLAGFDLAGKPTFSTVIPGETDLAAIALHGGEIAAAVTFTAPLSHAGVLLPASAESPGAALLVFNRRGTALRSAPVSAPLTDLSASPPALAAAAGARIRTL
jgi:outer membrane protein assembly factor BamB